MDNTSIIVNIRHPCNLAQLRDLGCGARVRCEVSSHIPTLFAILTPWLDRYDWNFRVRCIILPHEETGAKPFIDLMTSEKSGWKSLAMSGTSFNWVVHAYCQMTNHYHVLGETLDGNRSRGMWQLNGRYTQRRSMALSLNEYQQGDRSRKEAMTQAYLSGAYTMAEIGDHFGVHHMTVSRAAREFEGA